MSCVDFFPKTYIYVIYQLKIYFTLFTVVFELQIYFELDVPDIKRLVVRAKNVTNEKHFRRTEGPLLQNCVRTENQTDANVF